MSIFAVLSVSSEYSRFFKLLTLSLSIYKDISGYVIRYVFSN